MTTTADSPSTYKVIGTRPVRHDGVPKVTGEAQYGSDIRLPGMLYGKVLRSPHAHAVIKSIDTSRAEAHPNVRAVATAADLGAAVGSVNKEVVLGATQTDNVLASRKVLYKGHPVAGVAAPSPHAAEEALSLIDVEYEPLPAVTNVEDAMKPDAPWLHENWASDGSETPNVAGHEQHKSGDLEGWIRGRRRSRRARIQDPDRTPGVHRAAERNGLLVSRRSADGLVQQPGTLRCP